MTQASGILKAKVFVMSIEKQMLNKAMQNVVLLIKVVPWFHLSAQ